MEQGEATLRAAHAYAGTPHRSLFPCVCIVPHLIDSATQGGWMLWRNIQESPHFVLQEHKCVTRGSVRRLAQCSHRPQGAE